MGTRERLLESATKLFNLDGYFSTDTNKIARAAGFAPATFYKHFKDKEAIFLAVYEDWHLKLRGAVRVTVEKFLPKEEFILEMVKVILPFYVKFPKFRASVRTLSNSSPNIALFRKQQRQEIIELIKFVLKMYQVQQKSPGEIMTFVLFLEQLGDTLALKEFRDFGISETDARDQVKKLITDMLT